MGDSSTKDGAEAQPGLLEDEPVKPPPEGKGRRVLRPEELKGLPEGIDVECPTDNIEEDFKIFKQKNADILIQKTYSMWHWFKEVYRRYGKVIEDKDWTGNPEEIGGYKSGSQPERNPFSVDQEQEGGEGRGRGQPYEKRKDQRGRRAGRDNS